MTVAEQFVPRLNSYYCIIIRSNSDKRNIRIEERFHSSAFMQDKPSTLIGQLMKETMDERNSFLPPHEFLLSEFD